MTSIQSKPLCLQCGLCCNGVIFADGQLQAEDDVDYLRSLGLALVANRRSTIAQPKFHQPCAAFDGCRCGIYADRPHYCRQFECRLLNSVNAGHTARPAALRIIRTARRRVEKVKRLLRQLGDEDEHRALSRRFQKMQRHLESNASGRHTAHLFSQLTQAVHDLNLMLSEAFYPGSGSNLPTDIR